MMLVASSFRFELLDVATLLLLGELREAADVLHFRPSAGRRKHTVRKAGGSYSRQDPAGELLSFHEVGRGSGAKRLTYSCSHTSGVVCGSYESRPQTR